MVLLNQVQRIAAIARFRDDLDLLMSLDDQDR